MTFDMLNEQREVIDWALKSDHPLCRAWRVVFYALMDEFDVKPGLDRTGRPSSLGISEMMRFYTMTWADVNSTPIVVLRNMRDDMPVLRAREQLRAVYANRPTNEYVMALRKAVQNEQVDDLSQLQGVS